MGLANRNRIYSYSQLSQVDECPHCFYLQRIVGYGQKNNAFASQGSLIHDLIDQWAKGLIKKEDLVDEYIKRYTDEVREPWPKMLADKGYADKAFQIGVDYFTEFDGFEGYEILQTESKFRTEIAGRPFVGIIDMILKDEYGNIIVCDHKSKSLKSFEKTEDEMYRQQLLYSNYVKDEFGKYPDILMFNLFKEHGLKKTRPFDPDAFLEAMEWAEEQMIKIEEYGEDEWEHVGKEPNDFFCLELCSMRDHCPMGKYQPDEAKKPRRRKKKTQKEDTSMF